MRVVEVTQFGGPEVLVMSEAPDPVAGPGQVVISVAVADILFVETQIRRGWGGEYFKMKPPYVPGFGVAGRVISVGKGVDRTWIGQQVVTSTEGGGGCAERAVAPADLFKCYDSGAQGMASIDAGSSLQPIQSQQRTKK